MTQRAKVLWLIKGLGPGGAEQLLVSSATVADHDRFDYHAAFIVPWKTALVPKLEALGVTVHALGEEERVGHTWPMRLRRLLLDERFDAVHMHSPSVATVARLVARTLPRRARPALVSTEHNTWDSYGFLTRYGNALTSALDAQRWAVSHRVHDSIWPPLARRTSVLVHGLVRDEHDDRSAARAPLRAEWGLGDDDVLICTVANFRPNKSYPALLTAAKQVVSQSDRAHFISVGQGPLEDEIRSLHAQLDLGERFRLLGYRDDVADVLAASDIFALASQHEGFPIAVMEALAAGLPVVATEVGGVPDAVTPGVEGILVPRGQPDRLASALLEIVADTHRRQQMSAAARRAGQQFDIRLAVTEIEGAYDRLASPAEVPDRSG